MSGRLAMTNVTILFLDQTFSSTATGPKNLCRMACLPSCYKLLLHLSSKIAKHSKQLDCNIPQDNMPESAFKKGDSIMKRILAIVLFSMTNFITLGSALAQTHTVEAKIPFAFTVRNRVLPAGTYRISSGGANLVILRANGMPVIETSTTYGGHNVREGGGPLVFNKYGDQYFLREILSESATVSAGIPISNLEKTARIRETMLHSAEPTVAAIR